MSYLVLALLLSPVVYLLIRNGKVYRIKMDLCDQVSAAARRDIVSGLPWEWRYEEMNAVSYEKMLFKFWRKPLSLYDNLDFTKPQRVVATPNYYRKALGLPLLKEDE